MWCASCALSVDVSSRMRMRSIVNESKSADAKMLARHVTNIDLTFSAFMTRSTIEKHKDRQCLNSRRQQTLGIFELSKSSDQRKSDFPYILSLFYRQLVDRVR